MIRWLENFIGENTDKWRIEGFEKDEEEKVCIEKWNEMENNERLELMKSMQRCRILPTKTHSQQQNLLKRETIRKRSGVWLSRDQTGSSQEPARSTTVPVLPARVTS